MTTTPKSVEHNSFLLVECPKDYWCFHINSDGDIEAYPKDGGGGTKPIGWYLHKIDLPPGNYSIVGLAKDLTEEQWKEIVEFRGYAENDEEMFLKYDEDVPTIIPSATESGHSLLKHHGLKIDNCLILSGS